MGGHEKGWRPPDSWGCGEGCVSVGRQGRKVGGYRQDTTYTHTCTHPISFLCLPLTRHHLFSVFPPKQQYRPCDDSDSYVHRSGRTGRYVVTHVHVCTCLVRGEDARPPLACVLHIYACCASSIYTRTRIQTQTNSAGRAGTSVVIYSEPEWFKLRRLEGDISVRVRVYT